MSLSTASLPGQNIQYFDLLRWTLAGMILAVQRMLDAALDAMDKALSALSCELQRQKISKKSNMEKHIWEKHIYALSIHKGDKWLNNNS